jgi:hypothetical protein
MKKVLFLLAFVAVYGVSLAMTEATVVTNDEIVQVVDKVEKEKKEDGKKAAKSEAKGEGCSGGEAKAKADGCSGEKSAEKKSDCSKTCGGEKSGKS